MSTLAPLSLGRPSALPLLRRPRPGLLVLLFALLLPIASHSAPASSGGPESFFGLTNLWEVHLTITKADWTAMDSSIAFGPRPPGLNDSKPAWATCTFQCAGQTLSNVAIRCKGNSSLRSSRGGLKHPFRVDFNRGEKGREFFGLKGLSLNNNFNDATQIREALAYDACRRAGVPSPRTAFARVFLTIPGSRARTYLGLYTAVERVDSDFLTSHFQTKKGLLLKPERVRSLDFLGDHWDAYVGAFNPDSSAAPEDQRRFIDLTRIIAQSDDASFARELPARLDLDNFLRYLAVTALLANYDSFLGNGHNYYLFQPAGGGKASFIPWDLNEAFGGHPMAGTRPQQAELSVLRPHSGSNRLIDRVLANPEWAAAYRKLLGAFLEDACAPRRLTASAETVAHVVQSAVLQESDFAKMSFQRIALGQTNLPVPWARPSGPLRPEEMPLADWIDLRARNVTEELSGRRTGKLPRLQGMPGRRGGPPPGPRPN